MTDANDFTTVIERFYHWEKATPDSVFLRQPQDGKWMDITFGEAGQVARKMTAALQNMGLEKGDHIGIYSKNCYHWILADIAIMMGGYVSVPFYSSLPGDQLAEVVRLSDVKAVFLGKLDYWTEAHVETLSAVKCIKSPHYPGTAQVTSGTDWDSLIADIEPIADGHRPHPDDLWSIKFTSGTTGTPKGVMHSQRSFANGAILNEQHKWIDHSREHPRFLSYLPLNHVGERIGIELPAIWRGGTISFNERVETFARDIQETQPHIFFGVPRIWTHMYQGVIAKIPEEQLDQLLSNPATAEPTKLQIRTSLGFRDLEVAATGAAITPAFIKEFYQKLDIHLIEAYGMTELGGALINTPDASYPSDCVGKSAPWGDVRVDPDTSEIEFKSEIMMLGYYKAPEHTAEVLSEDGWLSSGDRGEIDEDGYVRIVGRVKDAFKTSKGSYITPNPLEEVLAQNEYVEQVCVAGLGIPQPIALVNLTPTAQQADKNTVEGSLIKAVEALNKTRANFERISTIIIQSETWSNDNGFLTPTLKIKRFTFDKTFGKNYLDWHNSPEKVIWI